LIWAAVRDRPGKKHPGRSPIAQDPEQGGKMIRVEIDKTIEQPIDKVFERLVDIDGYSQWLPKSRVFLDCEQTSEGPVGIGTTFIDRTKIGIYRGEVTGFQRPAKVSFRMRLRWLGIDVMESRPEYNLEPVEDGTRVHHYAEGELYGLFKLMEPYVARIAQHERNRTVAALKRSLETPSPDPEQPTI
jgi:uncharacterized protein YndB with AHSA1/START domain